MEWEEDADKEVDDALADDEVVGWLTAQWGVTKQNDEAKKVPDDSKDAHDGVNGHQGGTQQKDRYGATSHETDCGKGRQECGMIIGECWIIIKDIGHARQRFSTLADVLYNFKLNNYYV